MLLLLCGFIPKKLANERVDSLRRFLTGLTGVQCLAAILVLASSLSGLLRGDAPVILSLIPSFASVYLDGFSLLMLCLVSFVGFVVSRYSVRYLDGDGNQGSFFCWLAMTIGGVSLFVVAGNLLMLFAAWLVVSFGLHHLLVHYSEKPAARQAAWTKFTVSRFGDLLLLAAILLTWQAFGTTELAEIFAAMENGAVVGSGSVTAIAWLLMLAAATKSAQFPVHSWLPNTLESPNPVSALMHAGIVNAGGYLVIRMSPLIVEAPSALATLAIIGSITVGYAGLVMMTQSSIKRSLAYSTIAQMGFMMLQCGIGAFSAAMLHILAHSLYKAYAFLNSGSVLTEAAGRREPVGKQVRDRKSVDFAGALMLSLTCVVLSSLLFGINLATKPGGIVLGFVLTLALSSWLWDVFRFDSIPASLSGLATTVGVALAYMFCYFAVNRLVVASVPEFEPGLMHTIATTDAMVMFFALFVVHYLLQTQRGRQILTPLYVHASNGFYIDAWTKRTLAFGRN